MFNFLPFYVKNFNLFVLPFSILILFMKAQSGYNRACSVKGLCACSVKGSCACSVKGCDGSSKLHKVPSQWKHRTASFSPVERN